MAVRTDQRLTAGAVESVFDLLIDKNIDNLYLCKFMPKVLVQSDKAPVTGFNDKSLPSPLAQAIRAGDVMYVSAQFSLNPANREVVNDDIAANARLTLLNLKNELEAGGASLAQVVNLRGCMPNNSDFPAFN
jgi:2-iminobutanoate/2-iminopropanoate deaminase